MKLLLATGNAHKVTEISDMLRDVPHLEIVSLNDFPHVEMPEETGSTMPENARIKALHCLQETGLPSLADDSGVEVDAMGGAPGVHSAAWVEGSDTDRINAVLQRLVEYPNRRAYGPLSLHHLHCVSRRSHDRDRRALAKDSWPMNVAASTAFGYDPFSELTEQLVRHPSTRDDDGASSTAD
jgi:XTP/dITP diphosphohydrolase